MFRFFSFQWFSGCVLLFLSLLGSLDRNTAKVMGMHSPEESTLLKVTESDSRFIVAQPGSNRWLPYNQFEHQSKDFSSLDRSNSNRQPSHKKTSSMISNIVEDFQLEKPVLERLQSLQKGDKMIVKHMFPRARFEPGHSKGSLWHNFLRPKKTVVWSPEVLEKAPSGEKVVERYIENFDPEAFNKYITNEEKKTKQVLLSTLKKLTKADEKTNPSEFAQIIHELEPILNVKSLRLLPEESISNFFQPAFTITSDLTKSINSIIFETLKEHLNRHKSFLEPEENLWMFYRSLKDRLNESERGKGEFRYDSLSLEKVTKEMFKEAKSLKMINDDVLQKMSEGYTLSILLARLNFSKEDQNLTEEKALQIRQCLGSLYAFLLRYNKSIKSDPLPNSINEYLSKIYHRYSDSPELRHFANQLHQEYNSIFPESKRHDITKISLDDQSINE